MTLLAHDSEHSADRNVGTHWTGAYSISVSARRDQKLPRFSITQLLPASSLHSLHRACLVLLPLEPVRLVARP